MNIQNIVARIKNLLKPGNRLSHRVVQGAFWVIVTRLLGLATTMILARVLAPADFGLFGIALLAMAALETFSQTGLNLALVQKKQDISPYLNTAWTVQLIRGCFLSLIIFATAPFLSAFFDTPAAMPILQVIGFSPLILGFTNIGVIYFNKELEFHKQYTYELSGLIASLVVSLTTIIFLKNAWALVFGLLARNLVQVVMSYVIHPYRPSLRLNLVQFKELFLFGKWVLSSTILIYLVTQGDNILVGKLLGTAALGFYQIAYQISNMPATQISHVISQVTFPAYAKLQTNIPKLKEAYLTVLQITAFLSFPLTGFIFVLSADFTRIFLGEKWLPMVPAMRILVFAGLIRSIQSTMGVLFIGIGKPTLDTQGQCLRLLTLAICIYPLTMQYGISGTSLAVVASISITTIWFIVKLIKLTKCSLKDINKIILYPFLSILPIFIIFYFFNKFINITYLWEFIILAMIYSSIYLILIYLFDRNSNYNIRLLIEQYLLRSK